MTHYHLCVETWTGFLSTDTRVDPGPSDYETHTIYGIQGAKAAAVLAEKIAQDATAIGKKCAIIRRDKRGRGRLVAVSQ
tara:strand:- start:458 stop:694 length:237 start_codon:yes stop_codon:yes gene_type:complete